MTASNPVQSSPLNTNFQENGSSLIPPSPVITSEEKTQTLSEDSTANLSDQVNGSQNGVAIEKQAEETEELKCTETGKTDIAFEEKVSLPPATDNLQNDGDAGDESSTTKKATDKIESDEKPTG